MQHQAHQSRPRGRVESERSAEATRSATRRPGRPAGVTEPLARFALALAGTSQRLKDAGSFTPAGAEAMALEHTSLRRASRVRSKLSVAPVKDKPLPQRLLTRQRSCPGALEACLHAPEKAKRWASLFEPLIVRADASKLSVASTGGRDGVGGGGGGTRSLRRASTAPSINSPWRPVKDKHAPEKAKRRASFFEPLLVRADLLSCTAQSVRGCLSTRQWAAGTTDRVRRQALKGRSTQVSRASHCVDSEGKVTNHQAAATRAAREAGVTLQNHLDELESTLEQQLDHEAMKRGDEAPQPAAVCSAVRRFSASLRR